MLLRRKSTVARLRAERRAAVRHGHDALDRARARAVVRAAAAVAELGRLALVRPAVPLLLGEERREELDPARRDLAVALGREDVQLVERRLDLAALVDEVWVGRRRLEDVEDEAGSCRDRVVGDL